MHTTTTSIRGFATRSLSALLVSSALLLAACGGSSGDKSSPSSGDVPTSTIPPDEAVSTARDQLTAAEAVVPFDAPGPEFKVVDGLEGKTIFAVLNDVTAPFTQNLISGMEEAGKEFGLKIETVDGKRSAATAAAEIEKAVARKPAAIVVGAFQSEALTAALAEAKKAGIPVIEQANREAGTLPEEVRALGVSASVGFCYTCAGQLMADSVIADSDGTANIAIININDVAVSNAVTEAFQSEIAALCPGCTVQVIDTPAATTSPTVINGLTSAFVAKNKGDVYMVAAFDYYIPQIASSLAATDAADRTKLVGWNATHASLQMLSDGTFVLADLGASPDLMGWATIDAALRLLSGQPAVEDPRIPIRAFTAANIGDVDLDQPESAWYGGGYADVYKSLWK